VCVCVCVCERETGEIETGIQAMRQTFTEKGAGPAER